jgi:glyoxylase-like metal-dependent hydrolase (beta-lactamase superfamily II)
MKNLNIVSSIFLFIISFFACAQDEDVTIEVQKLSNTVYMLTGQGGNIGISVGEDGVLVIDDQYATLTPKIVAAIKSVSDQPIKFVANTHHHGDHTGGNENLAELGATIISHDNVRQRLVEKSSEKALPVITFNNKLTVHLNGEKVVVFHLNNAHTDGDAMLYFTESNVLHTGDIYFNGMYPYIDLSSGGTANGYIDAVKQSLMLIDDDTKIIPGHGKLSNKKECQFFLTMLETLKTNVLDEIESGKTKDEVATNGTITKTYDDLGYSWAFITSEKIRRTFYKSLKN